MRRTSPATTASANGRSLVVRRWSLALPAPITAQITSVVARVHHAVDDFVVAAVPTDRDDQRAAGFRGARASSRACPALSVGHTGPGCSGTSCAEVRAQLFGRRGASPVLFGLKITTIRSKGADMSVIVRWNTPETGFPPSAACRLNHIPQPGDSPGSVALPPGPESSDAHHWHEGASRDRVVRGRPARRRRGQRRNRAGDRPRATRGRPPRPRREPERPPGRAARVEVAEPMTEDTPYRPVSDWVCSAPGWPSGSWPPTTGETSGPSSGAGASSTGREWSCSSVATCSPRHLPDAPLAGSAASTAAPPCSSTTSPVVCSSSPRRSEAHGALWHVPHPDPTTGRGFVDTIFAAAGTRIVSPLTVPVRCAHSDWSHRSPARVPR